jgi:hypothetical protein
MEFGVFKGIIGDLKRRLPHYVSDYKDGKIFIKNNISLFNSKLVKFILSPPEKRLGDLMRL